MHLRFLCKDYKPIHAELKRNRHDSACFGADQHNDSPLRQAQIHALHPNPAIASLILQGLAKRDLPDSDSSSRRRHCRS